MSNIKKFQHVKESSSYDTQIREMNEMLDQLNHYKLNLSVSCPPNLLISEIEKLKNNNYKSLKTWKFEIIKNNFNNNQKPLIDECILVEDCLVEISDMGGKITVYPHHPHARETIKSKIEIEISEPNIIRKISQFTKIIHECVKPKMELISIRSNREVCAIKLDYDSLKRSSSISVDDKQTHFSRPRLINPNIFEIEDEEVEEE